MEIMRSYEPELQKMAVFLKERCDRVQYGLTYANVEKTLIRIPWPTVPRQNEDVSINFGMFTEWAYLSRLKRGNRSEHGEKESLSAQKHRFRNALARADGLRQCKELSTETVRVYEFVDTKKDKEHVNGNDHPHYKDSSPPHPPHSYPDRMDTSSSDWIQPQVVSASIPDSNAAFVGWTTSHYSPGVVSSTVGQTSVYRAGPYEVPAEPELPADMQSGERLSLGTLIEEMMNTPEPQIPQYEQSNGGYQATYTVPQPVRNEPHVASQGSPASYQMAVPLQAPAFGVATQGQICPQDHYLVVKAQFFGEEVLSNPVYNSKGFRLFFGHNIPDMRRLLDDAHRNQLQMQTKYPCEELFGPEVFDQVEMPSPRGTAHRQSLRARQIVENMDRGVIFLLDYPSNGGMSYYAPTVPNVYAMRLCQTRVFPFDTNVEDRASLEEDGLKRMQWVKVFDGSEFLREMRKWVQCAGPTPSFTVHLSVGQKVKRDSADCNLVTVKVSVTKAKRVVEQYFENQLDEIYISDKSSMDKAAQQYKDQIQARLMLDNGLAY